MTTTDTKKIYAERRAAPRLATGQGRHRHHPDRARTPAQPRQRLPVPPRQLLLLPDRLHRAQCLAGARRRRRPRHAVLRARRTWSARSGTATGSAPTPRPRRSASTRPSRSPSSMRNCPSCSRTARSSGIRSPSTRASRTRVDAWLQSVRARVRYGALCPEEQRDLCGPLDEMRLVQGRARTGHHAPRRANQRPRPHPRDAAVSAHAARGQGRARVPPRRRAAA